MTYHDHDRALVRLDLELARGDYDRWEHYDGLDVPAKRECRDCGHVGLRDADAMLHHEHICSECWIRGVVAYAAEGDTSAMAETIAAAQRALDWSKPLAECYRKAGYPTREGHGWSQDPHGVP
jgi:hypothetical protein